MANGWAGDGAVQDQIADSIADEVSRVRGLLPKGESLLECEECGAAIPEARRKALLGVRLCISCQQGHEQEQIVASPYNRRGNKDSQLR
jgi:phage/conjugal plasmid C-4 type zinc finger TraR family protein